MVNLGMKEYKVLITGANSYIGTSFEKWIEENDNSIHIDTLDMKDIKWRDKDFGGYDVIFHVAGIAHSDVGKATEEQKKQYYKINTELAIECAKKAKKENVKQFIFMSSMIVYGESAPIGKEKIITRETPVNPANFYGDSKVKAEIGLNDLVDNQFKVAILRPPMIYGKGSKGNYPLLSKIAKKIPIFPKVENQRSMLYIGNLCKFLQLIIKNEDEGFFFPQNTEYVSTYDMVEKIAQIHEKKIILISAFNIVLKLVGRTSNRVAQLINKAFGNIVYAKELSTYSQKYQEYDLMDSLQMTEREE